MYRIHFTAADLMLTRFVARPAPQVELAVALMVLRRPAVDLFDHWRRTVWRNFPRRAAPLLDLVYPSWSPDFLDVLSPDLDSIVDDVLSTPAERIRHGLDDLAEHGHRVTHWLRDFADGDREARLIMETALRSAHATVFGPAWARVAGSFHADLAYRNQRLLTEGVGPTLANLYPGACWRDATLEVEREVEEDVDVHLAGTGLTLTPSAFWTGRYPLLGGPRPGQPRLMIYPARIPLPLITGTADDADAALPRLLGRTRAAVLEAITSGRSTSTGALAHRLGISASRASEHATVLRQAGLITSHRHRNTVLHTPTALGADLLNGAPSMP